ncbi:MAG TPA: hypothetical protein VGD18_05480, partial [Thiobacillaceae bacterium]
SGCCERARPAAGGPADDRPPLLAAAPRAAYTKVNGQRSASKRPRWFNVVPFNREIEMNDKERSKLDGLVDELSELRDELRVRAYLARVEAEEEWDALEEKWAQLQPKLEAAQQDASKASKNVLAALELGVEELREGYRRIRDRLK